jgi:hypothetical protein
MHGTMNIKKVKLSLHLGHPRNNKKRPIIYGFKEVGPRAGVGASGNRQISSHSGNRTPILRSYSP